MGALDSKFISSQSNDENSLQQGKAFYQGECDDQGRHHGRGTMKYSDGSVFQGIFHHGMPQKGLFRYPNGNTYDGQLKDNKPQGEGIWKEQKGIFQGQFLNGNFVKGQVKYSDGNYFKGTMEDMMKQGANSYYRFKDGDVFQGEFRNDVFYNGKYTTKNKDMKYEGFFNSQSQKHGKGKLYLAGVAQYEGDFRNDQFDGEGILKNLKTLVKYEGTFKQGKKHGRGRLYGPDDKLTYEGEFVNNERHGKGIFYHQKKKYQGQFVAGKFQGQGILHYGDDGDVYKGGFKNNQKHGKGELLLAHNTIQSYKGDFVEDRFEGQGQVVYSNGDIYKGGFHGNKKHGKGRYAVSENNLVFEGEWVEDIKNGYFIQTSVQKGIVIKGTYKNGQKDGVFDIYQKGKSSPVRQVWMTGKKQYNK